MPEAPEVGLLTQYLFHNPWPIGLIAAAVAIIFGWIGLREGRTSPLRVAAGAALICLGVFATAWLVTTPAEHGERITEQFVTAAAEARVTDAIALLSPAATLALESPTSPGFDRNYLTSAMRLLDSQYRVDSHYTTRLDGYTIDDDAADVYLIVFATVRGYTAKSSWILRVGRQPGDAWQINRITCIAINDRDPQPGWFR